MAVLCFRECIWFLLYKRSEVGCERRAYSCDAEMLIVRGGSISRVSCFRVIAIWSSRILMMWLRVGFAIDGMVKVDNGGRGSVDRVSLVGCIRKH